MTLFPCIVAEFLYSELNDSLYITEGDDNRRHMIYLLYVIIDLLEEWELVKGSLTKLNRKNISTISYWKPN